MTIVHYEYRYKRPPRKKKPVAIEGPAVVRAKPTRRPGNTRPADVDDDRKPVPTSAIVTIRKRGRADVPDMTPEEHQRRGDAAEALFREMKRRIAEKTRQGGA
jgi:hypothetical protein